MDRILINNGTKRIEVNDQGEYIELPMGDQGFPTRFYDFVNKMIARYENIAQKATDLLSAEEQSKKMYEVALENMSDIDELFGECTCKKVFGDIVPDDYMIIDFFDQLRPYINKYGKERRNEIKNKYAPRGAKRC